MTVKGAEFNAESSTPRKNFFESPLAFLPLGIFVFLIWLASLAVTLPAAAQTESLIYSFKGGPSDGGDPYSGLLMDSHGNLFGTTTAGGAHAGGTVYKLSPSGAKWMETVLYSFGGPPLDGNTPYSGLVQDAFGNLYGTTLTGGVGFNYGTFYEVTPGIRWVETGLFSFPGGNNGKQPQNLGSLITDFQGNFFGTTAAGGVLDQGTVFEISVSNGVAAEQPLHLFNRQDNPVDGVTPWAALTVDADGNLYGTTVRGGSENYGAVFELTKQGSSWIEATIHSFIGADGAYPYGGIVVDRYGHLYGTTAYGGLYGKGTVYELLPLGNGHWTELVIHNFGFNADDGQQPWSAPAIDSSGNLYGTTKLGGEQGEGTVYKLSPIGISWKETVLYSFGRYQADGVFPVGGLIMDRGGNLYGTLWYGGAHAQGAVFKIAP